MEFTILGFMGESGSGKDFCSQWVIDNKNFCKMSFADPLKRFCHLVFGFNEEQLWGEPESRAVKIIPKHADSVPSSSFAHENEKYWDEAYRDLKKHQSDWVAGLALSPQEKADYIPMLKKWFIECKSRAENGAISARVVLQLLGTEYGRHFKDSIWLDTLYENSASWVSQGFDYNRVDGVVDYKAEYEGIVISDHRFINELEGSQDRGGYVIKVIRLANEGKANKAEEAGIKGHASETEQRSIPEKIYNVVLRMEDGAEHVYARLEEMFDKKEWLFFGDY